MKKIKLVGILLIGIFFVIGVCLLRDKKDYSYYLALGDYTSNSYSLNEVDVEGFSFKVGKYLKDDNYVNEVNTNYLKNNLTSKKLLEMIEKDVYTNKDDGIVKLIEKSKYITISLGINDLLSQIKYDSYKNKLVYDKEVISNKINVFKHNYHKIVEEIKDINNNAKVILVGCYLIYGDKDLALEINSAIRDVASENSAYYVDLSHIEDKFMYMDNELYLTNYGQEEVSNCVINLINDIN